MSIETDDLVQRMEDKYFNPKLEPSKEKKKGGFRNWISGKAKKWYTIAALAGTIGAATLGALLYDSTTVRWHYPERNVIYRSTQSLQMAGGDVSQSEDTKDQSSTTQIYRGSEEGGDTKMEDILASAEYHTTDESENYHLKDQKNNRVANAFFKKERVQSGISLSGSRLFQDQYGVVDSGDKKPTTLEARLTQGGHEDAFLAYRIEPGRGIEETDINVLRINGNKQMTNRLVEFRSFPLGLFFGLNFREGTLLENYDADSKNPIVQELFKTIEEFNKVNRTDAGVRVELIKKIKSLESKIPGKVVYRTHEDGIIDWLPQESTIYLAKDPRFIERTAFETVDFLEQLKERVTLGLIDKEVHKDMTLRVEHKWDFFPGNIPLLNNLVKINTESRYFAPFAQVNNGGYKIIDKYGVLAQVVIEDFLLHYDNVIYHYYLDKDGNGKIDKKNEQIGQVLFRMSRSEKIDPSQELGKGRPKTMVNYTMNCSFMGGKETDPMKRYNDFLLCAYVESLMPDQLNRGYNKHSELGFINEARSHIILFNEPTFNNLSRALSAENALVAAHDINALLHEAKRPYADDFARRIGYEMIVSAQKKQSGPDQKIQDAKPKQTLSEKIVKQESKEQYKAPNGYKQEINKK